jgi:hypothetical protein
MAALNEARAPATPIMGEVLWMSARTAFTLPGSYVYISRRLIECCASDAPVAFALAHEIAHHDLGHLKQAERWASSAVGHAYLQFAVLALAWLLQRPFSRERELAADAYALDLCRRAGFDMKQCLDCFDIMMRYWLDHHDLDGVYGSDEEIQLEPEQAAKPTHQLYIALRLWRARHRRSHPAFHERRRILRSRIEAIKGSALIQDDLGVMYRDCRGSPHNYSEAAKWFRKAANQSNTVFQYDVGILYRDGHGVQHNFAEAVNWFPKAANPEYPFGQLNLGAMYVKGVAPDYVEANKWHNLPAARLEAVAARPMAWRRIMSRQRDCIGTPPSKATPAHKSALDLCMRTATA